MSYTTMCSVVSDGRCSVALCPSDTSDIDDDDDSYDSGVSTDLESDGNEETACRFQLSTMVDVLSSNAGLCRCNTDYLEYLFIV